MALNHEQVSGIFNSYDNTNSLVEALYQAGIQDQDISVLMSDQTRQNFTNNNDALRSLDNNKVPEGVSAGAVSGGLLGALIGGLTLIGSVAIPGAGLLAAGPIVGALTGGAIGATSGGLIGALIGAGIPEEEAREYEQALENQGNIVVIAYVPEEKVNAIKSIFERYGAKQVKTT